MCEARLHFPRTRTTRATTKQMNNTATRHTYATSAAIFVLDGCFDLLDVLLVLLALFVLQPKRLVLHKRATEAACG